MPLNQKELSTELHRTQEKINRTKEDLEKEIRLLQEYQDIKEKNERLENYWIGTFFILGVITLNFILPYFIGSKIFSTNFNPKIGLADIIALLIGGAFLWKGIRK